MPLYKVTYRDRLRQEVTKHFEGPTPETALGRAGLSAASVMSIRRDWWEELDRKLPKSAPPLLLQARVLAIFAAKVSSGSGNPSLIFDRTISAIPFFKQSKVDTTKFPKVSDKIRELRFEPQIQLLANVGEASGTLADVLNGAADEIISRNKILSDLKMKCVPSIGVALVGLLVMLILPIFMVDPIQQVQAGKGVILRTNLCTDIMMFIGTLMSPLVSWVALIGGALGLSLTANRWWPSVRHLPGFSLIEDLFRVHRGYSFISAFLPLFSRGVQVGKSIEMLAEYSKGERKKVYQEMWTFVTSGGAISGAFESDYWDPLLRDLMRGFDDMRQEDKVELLRRTQPLMAQVMNRTGEQMASALNMLGLLLSVGITMVIFMGLTVPLMTVSVSLSG